MREIKRISGNGQDYFFVDPLTGYKLRPSQIIEVDGRFFLDNTLQKDIGSGWQDFDPLGEESSQRPMDLQSYKKLYEDIPGFYDYLNQNHINPHDGEQVMRALVQYGASLGSSTSHLHKNPQVIETRNGIFGFGSRSTKRVLGEKPINENEDVEDPTDYSTTPGPFTKLTRLFGRKK